MSARLAVDYLLYEIVGKVLPFTVSKNLSDLQKKHCDHFHPDMAE